MITSFLPLIQAKRYGDYGVKEWLSDGEINIGDLATATGVRVVTIRYYERIGLMPVPPRTEGNYHAYSREHGRWLLFIRQCRDPGVYAGPGAGLASTVLREDRGVLRSGSDDQAASDCH